MLICRNAEGVHGQRLGTPGVDCTFCLWEEHSKHPTVQQRIDIAKG